MPNSERQSWPVEKIKKYGGIFVSVWHNESLGSAGEWDGWNEVYDYLLAEAEKLNEQKD